VALAALWQNLDREVGRAPDPVAADRLTLPRDEQHVRLHDQMPLRVQDDVHRRQDHAPESALPDVTAEPLVEVPDDDLVGEARRRRLAQEAVRDSAGFVPTSGNEYVPQKTVIDVPVKFSVENPPLLFAPE
jgi:hypothetical protein